MTDMANEKREQGFSWEAFRGKTIFITGATGIIGQSLTGMLAEENRKRNLQMTIRILARHAGKAQALFGDTVEILNGTVESLPEVDGPVDFIIHGASVTASASFVQQPVETIETAVTGTKNILELARRKQVQGLVYLSSMEVYGHPAKGQEVREPDVAGFDPTAVRNSYPISKQLCEAMCCAYANEYGVPAKVLRLARTFGPSMRYDDRRVFAEFVRCAVEHRDIVLRTKGESEHSYLYADDASRAILAVLLKGSDGEAYTAANPATYCSIAEVASMVAELYGISVRYELDDISKFGYASTSYLNLNVEKLEALGWKAEVDLKTGFQRTVDYQQTHCR